MYQTFDATPQPTQPQTGHSTEARFLFCHLGQASDANGSAQGSTSQRVAQRQPATLF